MCGIAGKITWDKHPDSAIVQRMCDRMVHRGPDDQGVVSLGNAVLGHRRLSIIDLSQRGHQPMASRDKRYWIVYNGEVYNFGQLRKDLEIRGVVFSSNSDTEVVLYSYILDGPSCLIKFNGMFAFAIWDNEEKQLFLARDRFGKKPLYYSVNHQGISFASELTALMLDPDINSKISYEAINCYLALGYIISPMSMYEAASKLEPAHYLIIEDNGRKTTKSCFWDFANCFEPKQNRPLQSLSKDLIGLLSQSIKRRMISDVPVGSFLSGGLDSSTIVALAKKLHSGSLHTFSVGFDDKSYNEADDAESVARWVGTTHHSKICSLNPKEFSIDDAILAFDEPFADTSLIPMLEVSNLASNYVKVVLSGDGADELLAGYITYKADHYYRIARFAPRFLRQILSSNARKSSLKQVPKLDWRYKQKQFFYGSLFNSDKAHYCWRLIFRPEDRIAILGESYRDLIYDTDPSRYFAKHYQHAKSLHWLDKHLYVDCMTWLPDDILAKVDRSSMHYSIEARCPFLDSELVAFLASLPIEMKMNNLTGKYILRKAAKSLLPSSVLAKKKSGFLAPVGAIIGYEGIDEFRAFNRYVLKKKVLHAAS